MSSTDCTNITGYGGLSLYLRVCCNSSNLGQSVTITDTGINRYILCPKVLPKSCPGKLINYYYYYSLLLSLIAKSESIVAAVTNSSSPCMKLLQEGYNTSGVYTVNPDERAPFNVSDSTINLISSFQQVYCDMETDGGGWTVFQRRQDGSVNFDRNWTDYENGFGSLTGEFWLGLSKIHRLTKKGKTLRIDLQDFNDSTSFAKYGNFSIGDNTTQYTLSISNYTGTAGESNTGMLILNGERFATRDNDNYNCIAIYSSGGWWYYSSGCFWTILNGVYGFSSLISQGIYWFPWTGYNTLKYTDMKIR